MLPLHTQANTSASTNLTCSDGVCDNQIRSLHRLARFGSFEAMTMLSMVYATGDGREADPVKALRYLERAARHRYPTAVFLLSEWYRQGLVVPQDLQQANILLTEAVKLQHPQALYKRALQLLQLTDDASLAKGITLLQQASDKRLVNAMFMLARLKQQGIYTAADMEGAARLFESLVLSGHDESRVFLRETIAILAAQSESAELVADLQKSYDLEIIQVLGRDFQVDIVLGNMVTQLERSGLYLHGSMNKIRTKPCNGSNGCYSINPGIGHRDLNQTLTGRL